MIAGVMVASVGDDADLGFSWASHMWARQVQPLYSVLTLNRTYALCEVCAMLGHVVIEAARTFCDSSGLQNGADAVLQ